MIKTGDILKEKDGTHTVKVLGVCDEVYFVSQNSRHNEASSGVYTLSELKNFFEIPEEKWVPKNGNIYYFADVDMINFHGSCNWINDNTDQARLQRNLVFKTPEEAIARAKQLLNISE
jgi:hypothetical protein